MYICGYTRINVSFFIALHLVLTRTQSALHFTPWQTRSFQLQLYMSEKHSATHLGRTVLVVHIIVLTNLC